MGDFEDKNFPDAADSADIGWMIVEWKIMRDTKKCSTCGGNYSLKSRQFEDLPVGATRAEAIELFRKYKRNRRLHAPNQQRPGDPRRQTLFLCKVMRVTNITNDNRELLTDTEIDRTDS